MKDTLPDENECYDAFCAIASQISQKYIDMLRENYRAPDHTPTATQLANAVGYRNYNAACLQYGKLARLVMDHLGLAGPTHHGVNIEVFVDFVMPDEQGNDTGQILWVLRLEVAKALERMKWV